MQRLIFALVLTVLAGKATAAGFDCAKATKPIERTICKSKDLSELDSKMTELYRAVIKVLPVEQHPLLKEDQRRWLQERNHAQKDRLRACYEERLAELEAKRQAISGGRFHPFGEYAVVHSVFMYNPDKDEPEDTGLSSDKYVIRRVDEKTISFEIGIVGTNASMCDAGGDAVLSPDGKEYRWTAPKEEGGDHSSECSFRIAIQEDRVHIVPGQTQCDCGLHASFEEIDLFPAQKVKQ